jgi:hypothetical protein
LITGSSTPLSRCGRVLEQINDAGAGDGGVHNEIGPGADTHDEGTGRIDLHYLAVVLELPRRHGSIAEAGAQAGVA